MKDYKDKVVVITGSGAGIGFALSKAFAAHGAKVVVSDLTQERVQRAVDALKALGFEAIGQICDVTNRQDVEALADFAMHHYDRIDVLVNNAGVGQAPASLIDMDLDAFRKVLDVNLYGVLHGIQVFGRIFREQGTLAAIYNLGSENSIYPCVPSFHAYVSSKHAVLAISELLAEETPDFIEVAVIMPGLVETDMTRDVFQGMNADDFAERVIGQLKAGEFYIVSHAYNKVRLSERYENIAAAYDRYAPRYEGDDEYDIRSLIGSVT
ncbi:MAG: SDR family oxidoreductase [Halioglobus sp.]